MKLKIYRFALQKKKPFAWSLIQNYIYKYKFHLAIAFEKKDCHQNCLDNSPLSLGVFWPRFIGQIVFGSTR